MFNLLTPQEKKVLKKEYNARRLYVCSLAVASFFAISICFLFPLYVIYYYKGKSADIEYASIAQNKNNSQQSSSAMIQHLNLLISTLNSPKNPSAFLEITKAINARPTGIIISSISYTGGNPATLTLGGIATSRDTLKDFTTSLSTVSGFSVGDLPVSQFVRDTNIAFSVNVTVQ